jgi:hypothetical protein
MASSKRKSTSRTDSLEEALRRELGRGGRAASRMEGQVRAVLVPIEPSQQFVYDLGRSLTSAALRSRQSLIRRYRTAIVVGAALFGSIASVVGVIALIARQRSRAWGKPAS